MSGLVWIQGESDLPKFRTGLSDSVLATAETNYKQSFRTMIEKLRIPYPDMKFAVCLTQGFLGKADNDVRSGRLQQVQINMASEISGGVSVNTNGVTLFDDVHWDSESLIMVGNLALVALRDMN